MPESRRGGGYRDAERIFWTVLQKFGPDFVACFGHLGGLPGVFRHQVTKSPGEAWRKSRFFLQNHPDDDRHTQRPAHDRAPRPHATAGAARRAPPYSFCALWRRYSRVPAMMHSSICSTVGENQMPSTWNSRPMMNTTTHTMMDSATTSVFEERESSTA